MKSFKDRKRNLKRLAVMSSVAAGAGYVAGILTAPKSGKQTRETIKQKADRSYTETEKDLKKINSELTKVISEAKYNSEKVSGRAQKELAELMERAKDTKEKGREMLSALHEGSAEDKDLKKALKDANNALEHLRDYLKK
jgi:gas vesicle protein